MRREFVSVMEPGMIRTDGDFHHRRHEQMLIRRPCFAGRKIGHGASDG
jgi:hypothetical protein